MDKKNENGDLIKRKTVTVLINDKYGPNTNYKMTVSTNGSEPLHLNQRFRWSFI